MSQRQQTTQRPSPPALAERMLGLLPELYRESIRGDLAEAWYTRVLPRMGEKQARRWYWKQALRALHPLLWPRLGRRALSRGRLHRGASAAAAWARALAEDLRLAVRTLAKSPAYSAAALLSLTLGIGASTSVFSMVEGVLLSPLPIPAGERMLQVRQQMPGVGIDSMGISLAELEDYRRQSEAFERLLDYHSMFFILLDEEEPRQVLAGVVPWDFFPSLGIEPVLGRAFRPGDDRQHGQGTLLLSHDYWQSHFGGSRDAVGRTVRMNDRTHRIIGVLPPGPLYPLSADVYMPPSHCPFRVARTKLEVRGQGGYAVLGLLKEGFTLRDANRELASIAARIEAEHPEAYPREAEFSAGAEPLSRVLSRRARTPLLILLGTVLFVMLIVAANVANLNLARLSQREREIALRTALGAGRGRLLAQLLAESLLLALAGGLLGVLAAAAGLEALSAFAARFSVRSAEVGLDLSVLGFALGVSLASALAFGLLPGLAAGRPPARRLHGGSSFPGGRPSRLGGLLVVSQVALSFILLFGAGLLMRSFLKLQSVDPGFDPQQVVTMQIDLNWVRYREDDEINRFYVPFLKEIHSWPGISSAALSGTVPLRGGPNFWEFEVEGRETESTARAWVHSVTPGYFQAIGAPVVRGRIFAEDADKLEVAVNQTLARRYFGAGSPLGRTLLIGSRSAEAQVTAVVADVRNESLDSRPVPEIYVPFRQRPFRSAQLLLRTPQDPRAARERVGQLVRRMDPEQPVAAARTLEQIRRESLAPPRLTAYLLASFATAALLVTVAGIAGVVGYSVTRRRREFGVRLAFGAPPRTLLTGILRQGLSLAAAGLLLALPLAVLLASALEELLFETPPADPATIILVCLVLLAAAAAAALLPARRATSIDPIQTLRSE